MTPRPDDAARARAREQYVTAQPNGWMHVPSVAADAFDAGWDAAMKRAAQAAQRGEAEGIEMAWGIIANAGGGDWTKETREWQEAAARWRDEHMDRIAATMRARHAATQDGTNA